MRKNKLRELLNEGKYSLGTHIHSTWPGTVEIIGLTKMFDYIEFTGLYAPYDLYSLDNLARVTELYDMSSMMKIHQEPKNYLSQKALGSGIQNILFSDIRTVEDAREAVRCVRAETPKTKGTNGCSMCRNVQYIVDCGSPEFVQGMEDSVVTLMIEKESAVKNIEDILSVEGIDMIQFGPCDYSMSIGLPGQFNHPKVKEAERKVHEVAMEKGIAPRVEPESDDIIAEIEGYMKQGIRHFCLGVDVVILHEWLKEKGEKTRNLFNQKL